MEIQLAGVIAEWVGAVGTVLAFTATIFIIGRERLDRRDEHANAVAIWVSGVKLPELLPGLPLPVEYKYIVNVQNRGGMPIYEVMLLFRRERDRQIVVERITTPSEAIDPGESKSFTLLTQYRKIDESRLTVRFMDSRQRVWFRDLLTGKHLSRRAIKRIYSHVGGDFAGRLDRQLVRERNA